MIVLLSLCVCLFFLFCFEFRSITNNVNPCELNLITGEAGYYYREEILFEDTVIGNEKCRKDYGLNETYNLPL